MSTPAAAALDDAAKGGGAQPNANGGGGNTQFWNTWDKPEQKEIRDWAGNKNYTDVFTLAKSAQTFERDAAALRAAKGYPVDKAGADGKVVRDENAWKSWNAATGVPESPDKYEIPVPENNPYPQFKTLMAKEFHEAGVPAAMATRLAQGYERAVSAMETELRAAENTASERGMAELKDAWGSNFQERMAFAARGKEWLAKEVGGMNDLQMRTLEAVLGTPKFLSAMWKIGAGNKEASFAGDNNNGGGAFRGGASEAQARFDQLQKERAEGKITNAQWSDLSKKDGEIDQLINRIAAGNAQPGQ